MKPNKRYVQSAGKAVELSKNKIKNISKALAQCQTEATKYTQCVTTIDNLKRYDCQPEFALYKNCMTLALKKM